MVCHSPRTDVAVALALCHVLIEDNLYDKAFVARYVEGFEAFAAEVKAYTPEWAETISDVPAKDIRRIAHEYAAKAPHAVVDFGHRATFTTEEFEMRRALYAANVLIGNIERKGGIYIGQKPGDYNKLAGEAVAPVLANPRERHAKTSSETYRSGGRTVRHDVDIGRRLPNYSRCHIKRCSLPVTRLGDVTH